MKLSVAQVDKPKGTNVILGQAHFIKTVEDLHEALASAAPSARFGVAFCEASGPCLVRRSGNNAALTDLAARNAEGIGAGHAFVILMEEAFPIQVLDAIKAVREVCTVLCASANTVEVVVAETENGRGVLGVVDGLPPAGIETPADEEARQGLLRQLGYKL